MTIVHTPKTYYKIYKYNTSIDNDSLSTLNTLDTQV